MIRVSSDLYRQYSQGKKAIPFHDEDLEPLRVQLARTASHLAGRLVSLSFAIFEKPNQVEGAPEVDRILGKFGIAPGTGKPFILINIELKTDIPRIYTTFLEEAAHAVQHGLSFDGLPGVDIESAAREQASVWAVSISQDLPKDMNELLAFLEIMRGFDHGWHVFEPFLVGETIYATRRISNVGSEK